MAGDHKCPVCQATFTRPQHVARHMRSHTGDRPYKCQLCGDQFARSDLLARHINKCHANEKPLLEAAGPRRKGSASLSRATTSKQACDECVLNSLPCDGCNPCSKCNHRKIRCTFVKFHRQTAPVGPGHGHGRTDALNDIQMLSASSSSSSTSTSPHHPMQMTVPSMGENLFGAYTHTHTNVFPDPGASPPSISPSHSSYVSPASASHQRPNPFADLRGPGWAPPHPTSHPPTLSWDNTNTNPHPHPVPVPVAADRYVYEMTLAESLGMKTAGGEAYDYGHGHGYGNGHGHANVYTPIGASVGY